MPLDRPPSDKLLEAIYNTNKHAKKYAKRADEHYHNGKKAAARRNSLKKRAIYGMKTNVLNNSLPFANHLEEHTINGDQFVCLEFVDSDGQQWSFHQPAEKIHEPSLPDDMAIEDRGTLEGFNSTPEKEHSDLSLKESLLTLEEWGFNANDYLPEKYVTYGNSRYFVGWKYLD